MKNKYLIILNIVLLIVILIITQYNGLNRYYINNDMRQLFVLYNFPDNLKDNIIAQFVSAKIFFPAGFSLYVFKFFGYFFDFIFLTRIFAISAFLVSIFYLFKLGKSMKNEKFALILTALFMLYSWIQFPFGVGNLNRTFAVPLMLAFLYYLIKKNVAKLSIVFILQAIAYPPIWLLSLGTYGFSLIDFKEKKINLEIQKNVLFYISAAFSFALILVFTYFFNYGFTEQATFKQAIYSPEFYIGGRDPYFTGTIPFTSDTYSILYSIAIMYTIGITRPVLTNPTFILLLLAAIFAFAYRKKISLPKEIYSLLLSSILFSLVAGVLLLRLYAPNRYIKFSIPIIAMMLLAYGLYYLSFEKRTKYLFSVTMMALILFYIPQIGSGLMYCGDIELYNYMKALPQRTFAAHPSDADCIAPYGEKEPFVNYESTIPFYQDYYRIMKQRTFDFFAAYYAEDKLMVEDFCKDNEIKYLVVNKEHFTSEYLGNEIIYLNPFSDYIKNITKGKKEFYLLKAENIIFEKGNKFVVSCS